MKTKVLIMRPGEPHETREIELPEDELYAACKEPITSVVGEDWEHVNVLADFKGGTHYTYLDMFVDELGLLRQPPLQRNEAATAHYRRNALYHEPGRYKPEDLPEIVGPAVLFEKPVWQS